MTRLFVYKALCGGVGLLAGLFGMALEQRWLVWVAAALLTVAFTLRFFERKAPNP